MAFVVIYASTREQGVEIKTRFEGPFLRLTRAETVNVTVPTEAVLDSRGVSSLPAILWVENWADNYLILSQGREPEVDELRFWVKRYYLAPLPGDDTVRARVFGFVTDRSSGKPLVGASVSVAEPHIAPLLLVCTDIDGRYELPIVRPGGMILQCTHSAERSTSIRRAVVVEVGDRVRIDVQLDARAVSDVPYDVVTGEVSGVYRYGFELNEFLPDGGILVDSRGVPREAESVWPEFSKLSGITHLGRWDEPMWIRCTGTWAGPGSFGLSRYYLEIDRILEGREVPPAGSLPSR